LVSGFVLIGLVGLPGTMLTAGLLNVALALAVWLVVRGQAEPPPATLVPAAPSTVPAINRDAPGRWFLIAAFVTGAASFMYELG
ncbi:hypothetical protein, partial [Klebsiella pneumoniae]|uniref:hypothetical protein n=1 Tax=Klebsiella pneumoniae TaxID=573 RepID=UPI0030133AFB